MSLINVGDEGSDQITFTGAHSFSPSGPVGLNNDTHQSSAQTPLFPNSPYFIVGPLEEKEEQTFQGRVKDESRDSTI